MKNQNKIFVGTMCALACAFASVAHAGPVLDGGPSHLPVSVRLNANTGDGGQFSVRQDIPLPVLSVGYAPIGLTLDQTARLNLINMDVANGITVSWKFIDASGAILAGASTTLTLGKIFSVDFKSAQAPGESQQQMRAEVRVQVDILTAGVSSDSLRRSLEVFNNNSGETTVYLGGGDK
jgi:hypothetical protein